MDEPLTSFLRQWINERRESLEAGLPQDVAVSEVMAALPELGHADPLRIGLELLGAGLNLDLGPAQLALVLDLGPVAVQDESGPYVLEPPAPWSIHPAPHQVQLHFTPPQAGTDQQVESYQVPLQWEQPTGYGHRVAITYTVARPIGSEFVDWERSAMLTIIPDAGSE